MSRRSSGGDCASRLAVRKDLFPESDSSLDADFEQRIDELASARRLAASNGLPPPANGCLPPESKRRRPAPGGKNLNMFEAAYEDDSDEENEGMPCSVRLPLVAVPRKGGKPFSHKLSQLSSKCRSKGHSAPAAVPSGGKPRSMMGICSSTSSRKKWSSRRSERAPVYHSQIVDTNTIKIKIKKTSSTPAQDLPGSIGDIGQRRPGTGSSTRRVRNPTPSSSSGEEYDPAHGDTAASISVAAPKPRHGAQQHQHGKASGSGSHTRSRVSDKSEREESTHKESSKEKSRHGRSHGSSSGPQSPWASTVPITILQAVFEHVVASDGSLPSLVRLGMVCRLWHGVSLAPALWSNVDLAQCTRDKWKTDYKLAWLLENRLTKCRQLNLANWKIANLSWIIACIVEYCPRLCELNLTGWRRLSGDHLHELVDGLTKLQRIDLSFTSETAASSSALAANSLSYLTVAMGARLTHLTLANNKFTALQQILNSIAANCSSLELLDISGVRATSHPAAVPLERLQKGCTKLRIFRAANSQVVLANATTIEQMESPGFPNLEELSVACTTSCDYRLDDEALGRVLRGSTALRLLDVRGCRRVTDSGLVRVPAWDLQHLFLSGCDVTRQTGSCLELICEKWSHSLLEVDFAWATATRPLDAAVEALAEKGEQSKLKILNLCGSSVSLEPVKKVLRKCPNLESLNLSSCRALPRGMKRLYTGTELQELRDNLDPGKLKAKEEADRSKKKKKKKKWDKEKEKESESEENLQSQAAMEVDNDDKDTESVAEEPASSSTETGDKNIAAGGETPSDEVKDKAIEDENKLRSCSESIDSKEEETAESKSLESPLSKEGPRSNQSSVPIEASPRMTPKSWNLEQFSPMAQAAADTSSSTPKSESNRASGSWRQASFSPMPKPDSQNITNPSPETNKYEVQKASSSWNLDQFNSSSKPEQSQSQNTTESQQIGKLEAQRVSSNWNLDQFSPMAKQDAQPSPEGVPNAKQDIQKPGGTWGNLGQYSPMTRQDGPFSAQPSPYSAQPSPYSAQPSPYSSQQSPYSAQPSPDTSQNAKVDSQKATNSWNLGQFSPMTKQVPQFTTQQSPDPGLSVKHDASKPTGASWNLGQYSPMARQERPYGSQVGPYSPRPSSDASQQFTSRQSPSVGKFSPMMRPDCPAPSPDAGQPALARTPHTGWNLGQFSPMPSAATMPSPDTSQVTSTGKLSGGWSGVGRFSPLARPETSPAGMWSAPPLVQPGPDSLSKQWTLSQYRQEAAPDAVKNLQSSWNFGQFRGADALSGHTSGYGSTSAPNMWTTESGFAGGQLLLPPSACAGKSDKSTRTAGYGVDGVGNPVTTSCAVSNMFHGPLDGLNGPSGID